MPIWLRMDVASMSKVNWLARAGEHHLERRFKHDEEEDLQAGQTQGETGIGLPMGHRIDPASNDLSAVGAEIHDQRDHRRSQRVELKAEPRQPKIDKEQLRQKRGIADRLDPEAAHARSQRQRERAANAPATPKRKPSAIATALIHNVSTRPLRSWSSRLTTGAKWKL